MTLVELEEVFPPVEGADSDEKGAASDEKEGITTNHGALVIITFVVITSSSTRLADITVDSIPKRIVQLRKSFRYFHGTISEDVNQPLIVDGDSLLLEALVCTCICVCVHLCGQPTIDC